MVPAITADLLASKTDPDASPMKRKGEDSSHPGHHAHRVVDGGKSRVVSGVLVTPFEVTENEPMLELLWRSVFRWEVRPRQLTGDSAHGTVERERSGRGEDRHPRVRAPERRREGPSLLQSKEEFVYAMPSATFTAALRAGLPTPRGPPRRERPRVE